MSSVREILHPSAQAELDRLDGEILHLFKNKIIDEKTAQKMHLDNAQRLMVQGRQVVASDHEVVVICPECQRRHRMRPDVIEYRCQCDPHRPRFSFKNRER